MNSITVKAPAKVNLFLKVLSKRADGYHNINTLFERISLFDTIRISKIPKGIIVKSDKFLTKNPEDNLVYKAADIILSHVRRAGLNLPYERMGKIQSGVKIEIKKRIPVAAGLGGGSSDAAAVLKGINRLFRLRLSDKALLNMTKTLGADVPFFMLNTRFAVGIGRGDELKAIRGEARFWHLIIKAGNKTATKDVYKAFDTEYAVMPRHLTLQGESAKIHIPSKLCMDYARAESMLHNDLETAISLKKGVAGRISKSLAQLLNKKMIISGSGPSLFCLYRTRREAIDAKETVLRRISASTRTGWQIFVV